MTKFFESSLSPENLRHLKNATGPFGDVSHGFGRQSRKRTAFSDHAFGGKSYKRRVVIPLHPPESKHEPAVSKHLGGLGFQVHDYHGGLAKDKHGRDVKIGKVLHKSGAHKLLAKFNSDPARAQAAEHKNLQVVISRSRGDVAGMSGDRCPWRSCMSLDGSNRRYIAKDIHYGTHVAFLTKKGDNKAKNPLARINLKPHEAEFKVTDSGIVKAHLRNPKPKQGNLFKKTEPSARRTILHPESAVYGNAPSSFKKTVASWAEKHFHPRKDLIFSKSSKLYNDDGQRSLAGKSVARKIVRGFKKSYDNDRLFDTTAIDNTRDGGGQVANILSKVRSKKDAEFMVNHPSVGQGLRTSFVRNAPKLPASVHKDILSGNYGGQVMDAYTIRDDFNAKKAMALLPYVRGQGLGQVVHKVMATGSAKQKRDLATTGLTKRPDVISHLSSNPKWVDHIYDAAHKIGVTPVTKFGYFSGPTKVKHIKTALAAAKAGSDHHWEVALRGIKALQSSGKTKTDHLVNKLVDSDILRNRARRLLDVNLTTTRKAADLVLRHSNPASMVTRSIAELAKRGSHKAVAKLIKSKKEQWVAPGVISQWSQDSFHDMDSPRVPTKKRNHMFKLAVDTMHHGLTKPVKPRKTGDAARDALASGRHKASLAFYHGEVAHRISHLMGLARTPEHGEYVDKRARKMLGMKKKEAPDVTPAN